MKETPDITDITITLEETADINNTGRNNEPPGVPPSDQASKITDIKSLKKTFSNGRGGYVIKNSRCITHNKKLIKELKLKQKRVIGKNGILEVKSLEVPILVCPSSAIPENPALGESKKNKVICSQIKRSEDSPCNQIIEGKADRGIKAADRGS